MVEHYDHYAPENLAVVASRRDSLLVFEMKGHTNNPAGRPKGRPDRRAIYRQLEPHLPKIIDKMVALAQGGDAAAARLLLDRSIPVLKQEHIPVAYPIQGNTPRERAKSIILAAKEGNVSPVELTQAMSLINTAAQIATATELLHRVEKLEQQLEARLIEGEQL